MTRPKTPPRIAAVIVGAVRPAEVRRAASDGADLFELRVDTFKDRDPNALIGSVRALKKATRLPVLLTVRSAREGGAAKLGDAERLKIFNALIPYCDLVDIELSSGGIIEDVVNLAKRNRKKVIASFHDFDSTPGEKRLKDIIRKGCYAGADIVKLATFVKDPNHLKRLSGLLAAPEKNRADLVIIGMGRLGAATRIFFPLLGSVITYGSITQRTAPGQLSVKEIKKEFSRFMQAS